MAIDNSVLDNEIKSVLYSDFNIVNYHYTASIKIENDVYPVLKIIEIDEQHDYELDYGPVIVINLLLSVGVYADFVYPYRDKLEVILKTEKIHKDTREAINEEETIETIFYNARLDPSTPAYISNEIQSDFISHEEKNLLPPIEVKFQLKPKLLDDISKISIGGHFINTTNIDLLKNIITHYCSNLELEDKDKLLGVNVAGTASSIVKSTVAIPHGLKLSDLADYLQNNSGGVFPAGMAQFVHKQWWYVFPPYDITDYDDGDDKIVIISVPRKRYPQVSKTWLRRNKVITILATGNKQIKSNKLSNFDNDGNGSMYTDANKIIGTFHQPKGNVSLVNRGENNNEYANEDITRNHLTYTSNNITSNPTLATTKLARSSGHYFSIEWQNCDPNVIKPGMKVKIQYLIGDIVSEIDGTLIKVHMNTILDGIGILGTGYRTNAVLVIFVKLKENQESDLLGLN